MEIEGSDLNTERVLGFVKITDKGDAQQVTVSTKLLAKIAKFLESMEKMGFENVTVTVEKDRPLILGGKEMGIGIAPVIEDD